MSGCGSDKRKSRPALVDADQPAHSPWPASGPPGPPGPVGNRTRP